MATISSVAMTGQHDAKWIDDSSSASNITFYDNGSSSSFSRSLELDPQMNSILFSYGNSEFEPI
ncbi:MAG: hypothetical protein JKY86_01555 [Gammaproteobacteria bacterium]|nr:hypothetical protein [Gammaproteobacteria bacterium]